MSSHLALPREGHLEQVLNVFTYLENHHNAELVYDPSDPVIDEAQFEKRDWASSEFGHLDALDTAEQIPHNAPESQGMGFIIHAR